MGKQTKTTQPFHSRLSGFKLYLAIIVLDIIVGGIWYYVSFPALNIHNQSFWSILIVLITADMLAIAISHIGSFFGRKMTGREVLSKIGKDALAVLFLDAIIILIVIFGSLAGWTLFRAKSYSSMLNVEKREFTEDIAESESVTNIALMDTESARVFGNREIGSLSDVVSQYEVESDYTQINLNGAPRKVAPLKYASFFKWIKNRKKGIPGYVEVNPVNSDASYKKMNHGMRYVPSGYFNDNLMRHVQFQYPTKIIDGYYFEIDEEGNPFYICPCKSAKIGLFNGMDVVGAIICDPVTGKSNYYTIKDIPNWVDRVYDGDLCTRKYDWYGVLSGGFWNSKISQTNCTKTTADYGYIAMEDDVWVYTGVTSLNNDQSNVGFVMINQRTSEARYYVVSGAEEYSAMKSAEGTVQEKNYEASFPCLINVDGQPTYIMVLKDSGGLVKMYAMVNVEQYNIVATGSNQSEVFANYKKQMAKEGISSSPDNAGDKDTNTSAETTATFTIADIQYIVQEGETTVYIKSDNGTVYKQPFADNEQLITLTIGDTITVTYNAEETDDSGILSIHGFTMVNSVKSGQPAVSTTEQTEESPD